MSEFIVKRKASLSLAQITQEITKKIEYGVSSHYSIFRLQILNDLLFKTEMNLTGKQILEALENGVSGYPKLEGRFPQVAGISFAFDPTKPPMQRVDPQFVRIGDEYLTPNATYRLATKAYLHQGCDGYDVLKSAVVLVCSSS